MKTIVKNIIYFTLYYTGIFFLFLKAFVRNKKNYPVVILTYHRVVKTLKHEINSSTAINHPLKNFKREMNFLKRWFSVVALDEAVAMVKSGALPKKPTVAITFDDGFEDNYLLAHPVLKSLCLPATIFLTAGCIGTDRLPWVDEIDQAFAAADKRSVQLNSNFHNKVFPLRTMHEKRKAFEQIVPKLKHLMYSKRVKLVDDIMRALAAPAAGKRRMLGWHQIQEMSRDGIAFGAHTMSHPILSKMSLEDAKKEILESKRAIERGLTADVKHFTFPNGKRGDFSPELQQYCKEIGFESVCSCVYGSNKADADVFFLKRISPGRNFPIFAIDLVRAFYR